jgi:hypothetical protein
MITPWAETSQLTFQAVSSRIQALSLSSGVVMINPMKSYRKELWFNIPTKRALVKIIGE